MTRIKICCIASTAEAQLAAAAGADALGLVGPMPSGPGVISLDTAAEIAESVAPPTSRFLLSSENGADALIAAARATQVDTLQIVRHVDPEVLQDLARTLPSIRRVQVIHVEDEGAIDLIPRYEPLVHAFLLDSGKPGADTAELGGTGRTHDWSVSARFVKATRKPVFLAGGLSPNNVGQAIRQVRPFGVDLCSSVRTNGHLDAHKLEHFIAAVRAAERTAS